MRRYFKGKDPFNVVMGGLLILIGATVLLFFILACTGDIKLIDQGVQVPLRIVRWTFIPWIPFFIVVIYAGVMVINDED